MGASAVGVGMLVLAMIFGFLNGLPWEPRGAVAGLERQIQRESELRWNIVVSRLDRIEAVLNELVVVRKAGK